MQCPKCGADNPPGRVLCIRCGNRLRGGSAAPTPASGEAYGLLMRRLRVDLRRLALALAITIAASLAMALALR